MKFGFRTPNLNKKLKARTTGVLKRKVKKAVNPLYGKKGMGWINNPQKALYNKIYNKVTIAPLKLNILKNSSESEFETENIDKPNNELIKTYIFSDNFRNLITRNKNEFTKNFILSDVFNKLIDGYFETEDEIKDYIVWIDRRMNFNKNLYKFLLFPLLIILFLLILILLIPTH